MLESAGPESRLSTGDRGKVRIRGAFRVRDWTPEAVVRLSLTEWGNHLRLYVWGPGQGVAVFVSPAGAAYRIMQQPTEAMTKQNPRLSLASLIATDDRRGLRLTPGAYQIRCQQGAIVLTKGDVRLMTVPMEFSPKDLYVQVQGDATLQDLALLHSGPMPEEVLPVHRVVLDSKRPADLAWSTALSQGARIQKLQDGCVELATENTKEVALSKIAVAEPGLYEVIAQIDDATPGAGIALLNAKGEPLEGIEFGREGKTLAFGFGSPRERPWLGNFDFGNHPVPLAGQRQWLRLVVAGGSSRCWVSGDGVHWGRAIDPRERNGTWQSIALYARESADGNNPAEAKRHIRLRSLQVRELSGLIAAAPADVLVKAAAANVQYKSDGNESPAEWTARIDKLAPAGCTPVTWRYACAIRALSGQISLEHAEAILIRAVRERLAELDSLPAKIRLLQDAALVWRFRQDDVQRQLELWDRIGREALDGGKEPDFELYEQAVMQTSFGDPLERSGPMSWELARDATILFYIGHRDADLARMERLILFWRGNDQQIGGWPVGQQIDHLLQWLNVRPLKRAARRRATAVDMTRAVNPMLSRAASNILSELESALESKEYADAARVLVGCDPPRDNGLVAAPDDAQLFVSFQTALALLMLEHRGLRDAMAGQIGPADKLKIEQALAQGDAAAVEALPVQYCGTPDAALPCQWLGDRALAAADFAHALSWYDEGLRWSSAAQQPELAARKRLVCAILGSAEGKPPREPVSLGGVKVAPEKFEGWVREQLARRRGADVASAADPLPVIAAAQPVMWDAASFGRLDGAYGRGFRGDELPYEFREVDWTWRNLVVEATDDWMLAADRARITAFDLAGGKIRWDLRLGNGWSPSPVRPLVLGPRVFVRAAMAPNQAGVGCLDGKTGQKIWFCNCGGTAASDPFWCRGRLFVLTLGPAAGEFVTPLCLVELYPETGDMLARQQILEMSQRDKMPVECQVSWAGNRLIVLVAGSVISIDLNGHVNWLRQETILPSAIDPTFVQQYYQPAICSGDSLFVELPGSCAVDCLSAETGERHWQRGLVGLQRIIDMPNDRLLARTTRGFVVLNKATGEIVWQREFPGILTSLARTSSGLIVSARQATNNGKQQIVFSWLDMATGQTRAHSTIALEKNQPFFFGPMAARGDRLWCYFGYGAANDSPTAENLKRIIELRPGKPAAADEAP
jgi:outer membrane protein assembly factor BamB